MAPATRRKRGLARNLSTRRLAKTYVAIVREPGMTGRRRTFAASRKRETFEDAKAWARDNSPNDTTVEIRKEVDTGGIIDRVKLVREGRRVWASDFET